MPDKELKIHWINLIKLVEGLENGELTFKFQGKLPVYIVKAEGKIEGKDLSKNG